MHGQAPVDDYGIFKEEDVMTKFMAIFACSLLFAGPALAQADQHDTHHPDTMPAVTTPPAATASPAAQMPMTGSPMMNGDMAARHAAMHRSGCMMAQDAMHASKCDCPHHKRHGRHRHWRMHRK